MTDVQPHGHGFNIYPPACLGASPTYWKWVKLTVADVHRLRVEPGFQEKGVYFHLNHPIRHVYLCGTIVAMHVFARFILVTLDDSSGQTIELKIGMILPPKTAKARSTNYEELAIVKEDESRGSTESVVQRPSHLLPITEKSPTAIQNVEIWQKRVGVVYYETVVRIDGEPLDVGAVVVAKGTLNRYQGVFQLQLLRTSLVQDVGRELRIWNEYAAFAQQVLCKPWVLAAEQVRRLKDEAKAREALEQQRRAKATRRKHEADEKSLAKRTRWLQRVKHDERRREARREHDEQDLNGNALDKGPCRRAQ